MSTPRLRSVQYAAHTLDPPQHHELPKVGVACGLRGTERRADIAKTTGRMPEEASVHAHGGHSESHAPGLTDTSPYLGSRTKSEAPLSLCLGRTSPFCAVLNPAVAVFDRPQCRPQTAPPALASRAGPQSRCRLLPRSGSASTVRAPQQLGMPITGQPRAQLSGAVLLRDATHPRISTTPHVAPRPCASRLRTHRPPGAQVRGGEQFCCQPFWRASCR